MISYYKTTGGQISEIAAAEKDCWISVDAPSQQEIAFLTDSLGIDAGFVRSSLDEEESSHIEKEENQTLIIVDAPVAEQQEDENTVIFYTLPMGFVVMKDHIVTITSRSSPILSDIAEGKAKGVNTAYKTHFLFAVMLRIATRYIQYLRQIDKISVETEKRLHKSMKNQELIQLLSLEKSLVYFTTSLKSTETTLEKVLRGRIIKLYDEDEDLLEDTLVEIKQAIETANIYSGILSGTMDAFASIISNNLNIVMKVLTSITIVMAIPNIIFGFYGMNVEGLPVPLAWFPIIITLVLGGVFAFLLYKKGYFSP